MTDGVRPVGPVQRRDERRAAERRAAERRIEGPSRALTLTAMDEAAGGPARPAPAPATDSSAAAFAAQVLGQSGQRRGIKGGPPVLDAARSTYLGAKHSGAAERRPKPGKAHDTDV